MVSLTTCYNHAGLRAVALAKACNRSTTVNLAPLVKTRVVVLGYAAERFQLPAPDFRVGERRTTAVLFAYLAFDDMDKVDRVRACYQHCCLRYVTNEKMTNQTMRERFKLPEGKAATVSAVITATVEAGKIKLDDSATTSRRYARYVPFCA